MYQVWNSYWWLIFPLFWMVIPMAHLWSRHSRANRALDILKSYVDQGKDPPPELLAALQHPVTDRNDWGGGRRCNSPERSWRRAFLFSALAVAFGFMAFWTNDDQPRPHHVYGLVFVAAIMVALAASSFLNAVMLNRGPHDNFPKSGNG